MNKTKKKIIIALIILIIITISIIIKINIIKNNNNASTLKYYPIDNDKVIAITNIVGKRDIKSISKKDSKGIITNVYKYKNIKNVRGDINTYVKELQNNDYVNTTNINLTNNSDTVKFAKESIDKNEIIIITIDYNKKDYTITIEKGKGSIQPYN